MIDRILILILSDIEIKKINIYKSFLKKNFISDFLFILCCEIVESLQQHCWSVKCKYLCKWHHAADLQTDHKEKLSNSWKHTWSLLELNMIIWDIFCIRKVWSDSFIQKIQEV